MSKFFEPIGICARQFANLAEPAIMAFSVAGLTGGTLATLGILADHARGRGSAKVLAADDVPGTLDL
ncbi:hypothetical protein [Novosphingobium pentaromativorans]|uniref:Uncharacterized protein n=1 Tax=Novosphingobium pentaromativorans US6-1 TaxID=1088721 RepID=G6EHA9_9SPHN|nr:hypothetical protein [Novosphingobium pentaromativorans]AIT81925.1 hypothetical protein JI59_20380 [Novosphingobium pentaromativorans US6-1]EHJ59398.1 hypothetical protein NSU_3730 [Novosphingobium pentaromativorans US6-1]